MKSIYLFLYFFVFFLFIFSHIVLPTLKFYFLNRHCFCIKIGFYPEDYIYKLARRVVKNIIFKQDFSEIFILFTNFTNYPFFFIFGIFFLFTSIFSLLFFMFLGFNGVFVLNLISLLCFWLSLVFFFFKIIVLNYHCYISFWGWLLLSSDYKICFDFYADLLSFSFAFLTISIGLCVYIFAFSYFRYEPNVERLLLFLNLFMVSMVALVLSGNFINLFLGWELIGVTSFLLINFWTNRISTLKSSFKAYSFNKISDAFLFLAILLVFQGCYSLDIVFFLNQLSVLHNFYIQIFFLKIHYVDLLSFFFIFCAFIKSAQFGFHLWLPDSMEAPVPASALIHSATLVSAGVFLILRLHPLFEMSYFASNVVVIFGAVTAFFGGVVSMLQFDTKKILAFSTISHCGFLMVLASTGNIEFTLIYLYVHGFFKAAVFMCVGSINRFAKNLQDFKKMGSFWKFLVFELFLMSVGLFNLCGLPFSLGFVIKHLLFLSLDSSLFLFYFVFINCFLASITGIFYSSRLFYYVLFDFKKGRYAVYKLPALFFTNSSFYSNTTLASNFAIILIFFFAYFFCYYFIMVFGTSIFNSSDVIIFFNSSFYYSNYLSSLNFLSNFFISNFFIFFLVLFVCFFSWRSLFLYNSFMFIYCIVFFYFYTILFI